jgi:hypothetical protein
MKKASPASKKAASARQSGKLKAKRTCGECTVCCEGHLEGTAYGHHFSLGWPCHFMTQGGCSIYADRPQDPCKKFNCVWLSEDFLPAWFRPDKSNVLVTWDSWGPNNDLRYLKVTERGVKIDSVALNLIYKYHMQARIPLTVQVDRGWNHYGPYEFVEAMHRLSPESPD